MPGTTAATAATDEGNLWGFCPNATLPQEAGTGMKFYSAVSSGPSASAGGMLKSVQLN